MAATRSRREWLRDVESASLTRRHPEEDEAAARFDALEPPSRKMALVREIVATRAAELTLAYRNVVMVTAGFKSRRSSDGVDEVHPQPCVIFVVKRKWAPGAVGPPAQALPAHLLCFGGDGADRRLYAVPTDVQPAAEFHGAVARTASCVRVDDPDPDFSLPGTVTCGVRLHGAAGAPALALSAMHVLSPIAAQPLPAADAELTAVGAGPEVRGRSTAWGGHIDGETGSGFDAQLASIDDLEWFNAAFAEMTLAPGRPYVDTREAFDDLAVRMRFQILAPANHPDHLGIERQPMLAQFSDMAPEEQTIDYQIRFRGLFQTVAIRHRELVRLRVLDACPPPHSGDSGSAVVSWWPDGSMVLTGMFIASHGAPGRERVCYVLPAWQLFDTGNWSGLPLGTGVVIPTFVLP
jgi:hypothetical protein